MSGQATTTTLGAAAPGSTAPFRGEADVIGDRIRRGTLDGLTVLLVEDEPRSREALALVLAYHGARVTSADSVRAGLSCYERTRPSVVVSDIGLPDDDGFVLMRTIRARELGRGHRTPAIAVSGFPSGETSERAYRAGFDVFLAKPIDVGLLVRALHALTARR